MDGDELRKAIILLASDKKRPFYIPVSDCIRLTADQIKLMLLFAQSE